MKYSLTQNKKLMLPFISCILYLACSVCSALPFVITPKEGTQLPTQVRFNQQVTAYYTIANNTLVTRSNNFVKYLPRNTRQVTNNGTYEDTCGATFNLAGKGQVGDSCTLQLSITGAVFSEDPNSRNHLMVCFPGGLTCAGTQTPLEVKQPRQVAYISELLGDSLSVCPILNNGQFGSCGIRQQFNRPESVAINPAGTFIYVSNGGNDTISYCPLAIDGSIGICANQPTPTAPEGITINPAGTFIYIVNSVTNLVSYCPLLPNGSLGGCAIAGNFPGTLSGITINPAGTYAYVTEPNLSRVYSCPISNSGAFGVCATNFISTPVGINTLAFNPVNNLVYLVNFRDISYCNVNTNGTIGSCTVALGGLNNATGIAFNALGTHAYITEYPSGRVILCPINPNGSFRGCTNTQNDLVTPTGIAIL
ncbi:MAG: YncE family protein [Legionella sp.]|nr:YncE family protein [Legionella sp.]